MGSRRLGTDVSSQALKSQIQRQAGCDERIPELGVAAEHFRVRFLAQELVHRELGIVSQQFPGLEAGFRIPTDFGVARNQQHLRLKSEARRMAVGFDRVGGAPRQEITLGLVQVVLVHFREEDRSANGNNANRSKADQAYAILWRRQAQDLGRSLLARRADFQRVDLDRLGDVLESSWAEIA